MKENDGPMQGNDSIREEKTKSFRLFGFRSRKWYKMLLASLYLLLLFISFVAVLFSDGVIQETSTFDSFIDKASGLIVVFAFFVPYLILSNIFGLRDKLPLYRKHKFASTTLAILISTFVFVLIGGQILELHSNEYEKAYAVYTAQQEATANSDNKDKSETDEKGEAKASDGVSLWDKIVGFFSFDEKTEEKDEVETFDGIANDTLNTNFLSACKKIGLKVGKIKSFQKEDDWAGGERYSFSYYQHPMTLYANGDNTINSVNLGDIKLFLQGFESYPIKDFLVDMDIADQLAVESEDYVKSNLNYPSSADFSMLNWSYGRERSYYQLTSSVEAKNAFGVESEIPFRIIYKVNGDSHKIVAFMLDGTWIIDNKIPKYDKGRKEIKSSSTGTSFTLVDEALGAYGEKVKIDSSYYVWYKVPKGTYTVTSNSNWCMVYVDKDKTTKNSDGYTEVANVKTYEFTATNQQKTVKVGTGQHIFLTVNANVTFEKQ